MYDKDWKANRMKMIRHMYSQGETMNRISQVTGVSKSTVKLWLVQDGVKIRKNGLEKECPNIGRLRRMAEEGYSQAEIGKLFSVSPQKVYLWLLENNIQINKEKQKKQVQEKKVEHKEAKKAVKKCRWCIYRGTVDGKVRCCYILKHEPHHSRGCQVDNCDKFVRGRQIRDGWELLERVSYENYARERMRKYGG